MPETKRIIPTPHDPKLGIGSVLAEQPRDMYDRHLRHGGPLTWYWAVLRGGTLIAAGQNASEKSARRRIKETVDAHLDQLQAAQPGATIIDP
jgi:hypothetical protein